MFCREDVELKPSSLSRRSVHSLTGSKQKDSSARFQDEEEYSPERSVGDQHATKSRTHHESLDSRKKRQESKRYYNKFSFAVPFLS